MKKGAKAEISVSDAIKKLAGKPKLQTLAAKVVSVNEAAAIANVSIEMLNDLEIEVRLTAFEMVNAAKAMLILPTVGSYVLLQRIEASDDFSIVSFTEVDSIYLGGKQYSAVKGETLETELNKNNAIVNALHTAFKNGTPPTIADGGVYANALLTALKAAVLSLPAANYSNIKNPNVKHG